MIELWTWNTPNGRKVSIALEEMALPYSVHTVNIGQNEQFDPAFLAFSPNNRIPAIKDPDGPSGEPITVFESGAILIYLGQKTGKFWPSDIRGQTSVLEWLMWQMGGLRLPRSRGRFVGLLAMAWSGRLPFRLHRLSETCSPGLSADVPGYTRPRCS